MKRGKINKDKLRGIGGWLIIPLLNFIALGAILLYDLLTAFTLEPSNFTLIAIVMDAILLFLVVYTLVLLFGEKKAFVNYAKITLWSNVAYRFILLILIYEADAGAVADSGFIQGLIFALIWTSYFNKSKRVKNTFVK